MTKRYSKTTRCFYPSDIDYPSLPSDLIDVPDADYHAAMARQAGDTFDFVDGRLVIAPPPDPAPSTPTSVTPRQARLALRQQGLLSSVKAAIAAADEATQIEWEYATEFERASPVVAALAATLGLSQAQLDGLFTLAATL